MSTDEIALKLYQLINPEELMEAKREGKVLAHFIKIAAQLQNENVIGNIPPHREEVLHKVLTNSLESTHLKFIPAMSEPIKKKPRTRLANMSDEGIRMSEL